MMVFDQVSPIECEARVFFGACVNPKIRKEIKHTLGREGGRWFSDPILSEVYTSLIEQDEVSEFWDTEVLEWLSRTQGGDITEEQRRSVINIFGSNSVSATAPYYADLLLEHGRIRLARELGESLLKSDSIDSGAIEAALRRLDKPGADAPRTIAQILPEAIREQDEKTAHRVSTGYKQLDEMLCGGFGRGHFFVVGARTGRGKTAISINLAINAAKTGENVLFYALEMSDVEIVNRAIRVHTGFFPGGSGFAAQGEKTSALPLKIAKASKCTVTDIEVAIDAEISAGTPPGLIVVDYLQLLLPRARSSNRQEQVAEVSRDLKRLARVTGIPIISPSQLRRPSDDEGDSAPALHHLRESGSIEQDADAVLLLSGKEGREHDSLTIRAELAKNRHGRVGTIYFEFHLPTQRFTEIESVDFGRPVGRVA